MKRAIRKGLVAPGLVALVTAAAYVVAGPGWALAVLAVAAAALVGFHLYHLQLVIDWAAGPLDAKVPLGSGEWVDAFAAIHRRVRLRAAYQRDLRGLIDRFRRASDALPDGIVLLDEDFRIEWANPSAVRMFGLDMPRDHGQPMVNLFRSPAFQHFVESGRFDEHVILESLREPRTLSLQIVPFSAREKLLIGRDISQLERVARMRRDFIANVSHELKTPLTVIGGFLETLEEMDLEPRQRSRYLGLMQDQAKNMQRLVNDLLALSALESEQNPVLETEFAIVPLLLEISSDAKALSQRHHEVTLEIGEAAGVVGSREELASAFTNLVSNAVRYTPDGGSIALHWRVEPEGVGVFAVTDSGIGVAPEHIPRLTERFYRVDRSRSRNTGGTGLGLAIVKHVLIRHQADLDIRSTPGQGSTFAVRIPAKRVRRATSSPAEGNAEPTPSAGTKAVPSASAARRGTAS
jgi:two-component system phosphate regulon sensor histidine kinase PhoR